MKHLSLATLLLVPLVVSVPAAHAVDGVKLIGQPKASAFPVTLSAPGSYRLRANITVPDANTTAIFVAADDVTLDLNGFSILGGTVCTGDPVSSCAPLGAGRGIDAAGRSNVTVRNGAVRGMGGVGILVGEGAVDRVRAISNGGNGIEASDIFLGDPPLMVTNCTAKSNGGAGIIASSVIDSNASFNQSTGIFAGQTIDNCSARRNGGVGLAGFGNLTTVTNSTAGGNAAGINAYVVANSAAVQNSGIGIQASAATGCAASGNTGAQISAVGLAGQNLCTGTPCP